MRLVDIISNIKVLGIPTREACVLIKDNASKNQLPKIILELADYDNELCMLLYTQLDYLNRIKTSELLENKHGVNWYYKFKQAKQVMPLQSSSSL